MLWTSDIAGKEGSFNGKEGGEIGKLIMAWALGFVDD